MAKFYSVNPISMYDLHIYYKHTVLLRDINRVQKHRRSRKLKYQHF